MKYTVPVHLAFHCSSTAAALQQHCSSTAEWYWSIDWLAFSKCSQNPLIGNFPLSFSLLPFAHASMQIMSDGVFRCLVTESATFSKAQDIVTLVTRLTLSIHVYYPPPTDVRDRS